MHKAERITVVNYLKWRNQQGSLPDELQKGKKIALLFTVFGHTTKKIL